MTAPLCHCGQVARRNVVYINRRTQKSNGREAPMCDTHVQQEITLAMSGLSMVDIDINELELIHDSAFARPS